jgi:hypothetical protein
MLHRGIKFAYAIIMIASAALAFILVRNFDEIATRGPSYTLNFRKAEDGASAGRVAATVEAFARSRGVNIGRLYYDPLNDSRRCVYLAVGNPNAESTEWLEQGYPYFSRETNLDFRPYSEIANIEPNGEYLVYGSGTDASELLREFERLGYEGEARPAFTASSAAQYFGHGAILSCFLIVGLVAIVAVASAVALGAKSYAIQRLQGQSFFRISWRDIRQLVAYCAVVGGVVSAVAAISLYLYNDFHQISTYVLVAVSFASIYVIAVLLTHIITLALLHRSTILSAVKGEVTAGWAIVGSYVLRCWGIFLILSISSSAIASGLMLKEQRQNYRDWSAIGSAYYMRIDGAVEYLKDGKRADDKIGNWIRESDTRNELALASRQNVSGPGRDFLVVNNRYLTKHEIDDVHGSRVSPVEGNAIRILIPQQYSNESTEITTAVNRWVQSQRRIAGTAPPPGMDIIQTREDQHLVSYTRLPDVDDMTLKDPILVVVTGSAGVISNDQYVTYASRGEVLIEDPNQAMKGLAEAGAGSYILGMSPFAQDAANRYRDAKREFSVEVFNLVAGITVLLVTALAVSVVYCRRNGEVLFVKYIHGWGFVRTHWGILAFEFVLGLTLVLWSWHSTAAIISRRQVPGAPMPPGELMLGGWEPVVAGGAVLASLTLVVFTLLRTSTGFAKSHSASLS